MAVFYKYEYTNKRKNIHPWSWVGAPGSNTKKINLPCQGLFTR